MAIIALVLSSLLLFTSILAIPFDESVVKTNNGPVQGIVADDYRVFFGIPYAQPPIGSLRWSNPLPASSWSGVYNATVPGPACPQNCTLPPHTCPTVMSEDCLSLNVWTPRSEYLTSPVPVMVYIPGGRFEQGEAGSPLYYGETIVNASVIMVTINYRLGALGFLYTGAVTGNFGFLDQQLALKWVQSNIAAFGGDPSQVTLFGQSAGAASLACHLVSPYSKNLFIRGISQSNPLTLVMKDTTMAQTVGNNFLTSIGCPSDSSQQLSCLRSQSIDQILVSQKKSQNQIPYLHPLELFLPWTPLVDGHILPQNPFDAFQSGNFNEIPLIIGTVKNDALLFVYQADGKYLTEAEYIAAITYIFSDEALEVLDKYPPHDPFHKNDSRPELSKLGTDYIFACSTRKGIRAVVTYVPAYLYEFDHVLSFDPWGPDYPYCVGEVCHGSELPFVFNNVKPYDSFTPDEQNLSTEMTKYWTNFAISGNPNFPIVPQVSWPVYNAKADISLSLDIPISQKTGLLQEYCDFWDSKGYSFGL